MLAKAIRYGVDEARFRRIFRKLRDFTMIPGPAYVGNLHLAARVRSIGGNVVECGTWRGGMIAGIADVLGPARTYYLFDSFEGLPATSDHDGEAEREWVGKCVAAESDAARAMSLSVARDVRIVKGWFNQTLPLEAPSPIALLRLDGDWYESTKCVLDNYGDHVVPGGLIIVDDYHTWEGCTQAVNEFAADRKYRIHQSWPGGICFIVAH